MRKESKYKELAVAILSILLVSACGSTSTLDQFSGEESGGVEFSNEYSSPEELGVGDLMYVNFGDSDHAALNFSGVESSAKFVLVVGSASEAGVSTSISISSDLSAIVENEVSAQVVSDDYSADEILSAWLRAAEMDLAVAERAPAPKAIGMKGMAKAIGVGDTENFRVLSSLATTTTYTIVEGKVRCVGSNVIFYVDSRVSDSLLSDADIGELCSEFDSVAGAEQDMIGDASDINGDGRVAILMTPQINRLGSMGGGIITGYFWAGDLYDESSSNPVSNEREIIYTMVPDPSAAYGVAVTKDFTLNNLLPAVLPHELQHAINYNQHVFVKGMPPEQNWLNEGISHLMEDIMGYGQENPSRYALYLANTTYGGVVTMRQPNLYERGASYLFLRYLYEQASSGDSFLKKLVSTNLIGVDNLESAFAGVSGFSRFHEFLARWTAALALTDEGITQDMRYIYRDRVVNSATGHWEGVCVRCDADDGRGTLLSGVAKTDYSGAASVSIAGSAAKFYSVDSVPAQMTIAGTGAAGNFGVLIRVD